MELRHKGTSQDWIIHLASNLQVRVRLPDSWPFFVLADSKIFTTLLKRLECVSGIASIPRL